MISAFGVVHKSETRPGEFKRAVDLEQWERGKVRSLARARLQQGPVSQQYHPRAKQNNLAEAYRTHGYAQRSGTPGAVSRKMKQEFDPAGHTPSGVHRNIAYGPSTTPKMQRRLDRKIDPTLAQKLKHPVVFHRDETLKGAHAAAIGAHTTSGSRGHVVLGDTFKPSGKRTDKGSVRRTVNHELAHAQVKQTPSAFMHRMVGTAVAGEEGRADAVSRTNVYRKSGMMRTRKELEPDRKYRKMTQKTFGPDWVAANEREYLNNARYNKVKRAIKIARKLK